MRYRLFCRPRAASFRKTEQSCSAGNMVGSVWAAAARWVRLARCRLRRTLMAPHSAGLRLSRSLAGSGLALFCQRGGGPPRCSARPRSRGTRDTAQHRYFLRYAANNGFVFASSRTGAPEPNFHPRVRVLACLLAISLFRPAGSGPDWLCFVEARWVGLAEHTAAAIQTRPPGSPPKSALNSATYRSASPPPR